MHNVINFIKKLTITQKLMEFKRKLLIDRDKYITTPKFNRLAAENFPGRQAQAYLISKNDIVALVKKQISMIN